MNSYLQILTNVTTEREVVNTTVIIPVVLITAPVILDINYNLIGVHVEVTTELVCYSIYVHMCVCLYVCPL